MSGKFSFLNSRKVEEDQKVVEYDRKVKSEDELLQLWKNARNDIFKEQNDLVFRASVVVDVVGIIILLPSAFAGTSLGHVFMIIGVFIAAIGVSIFATINPSTINFDSFFDDSILKRALLATVLLLSAVNYIDLFVPGMITTLFFAITFLFPYFSSHPHNQSELRWYSFTNRLIFYSLGDDIVLSIAYLYNGYESANGGSFSLRHGDFIGLTFLNIPSSGCPRTSSFASMYMVLATFVIFDFVILFGFYIFEIYLQFGKVSNTENIENDSVAYVVTEISAQKIYSYDYLLSHPLPDSALAWLFFYAIINKLSIAGIIRYSFLFAHFNGTTFTVPVDDETATYFTNFEGASFLVCFTLGILPPVFLLLIGPDVIFEKTCKYWIAFFSKFYKLNTLESIGGYMFELLEYSDIKEGDPYWYHEIIDIALESTTNAREPLLKSTQATKKEHKFLPGTITELTNDHFQVTLDTGDKKYNLPRLTKTSFTELKQKAKTKYVSWDQIANIKRIFYDNNLCPGIDSDGTRRIDFFISHAWADDVDDGQPKYSKWNALKELADEFSSANDGRMPTFWLDRCCHFYEDEDKLADNLKMLPVNIMRCNKMVVLYGNNYLTRIWCVWELLTICALNESMIMDRLIIRTLPGASDFFRDVKNFDVEKADAFDKNERHRALAIIKKLGAEDFNNKVRNLADKLQVDKAIRSVNTRLETLSDAVMRIEQQNKTIESQNKTIESQNKTIETQNQVIERKIDLLLEMRRIKDFPENRV